MYLQNKMMKNMQFQWQLAMLAEDEETYIPASEYLQMYTSGMVSCKIYPEFCGIFITSNGKEVLFSRDLGRFGRADILVLEFEEAQKRLSCGHRGLVRPGDNESIDYLYLLLDPQSGDTTHISLIFLEDESLRMQGIEDRIIQEVYDYVDTNIEKLHASAVLARIAYPTLTLIDDIGREAAIGRQIVEQLGISGTCWL